MSGMSPERSTMSGMSPALAPSAIDINKYTSPQMPSSSLSDGQTGIIRASRASHSFTIIVIVRSIGLTFSSRSRFFSFFGSSLSRRESLIILTNKSIPTNKTQTKQPMKNMFTSKLFLFFAVLVIAGVQSAHGRRGDCEGLKARLQDDNYRSKERLERKICIRCEDAEMPDIEIDCDDVQVFQRGDRGGGRTCDEMIARYSEEGKKGRKFMRKICGVCPEGNRPDGLDCEAIATTTFFQAGDGTGKRGKRGGRLGGCGKLKKLQDLVKNANGQATEKEVAEIEAKIADLESMLTCPQT